MQLEVHAREGHERFDYFVKWWASLEAAGLRPFWTEANVVYINIVRGAAPELAEVGLILEMWKKHADRMFFESTHLLTSAAITRLLMKHLTKPKLRLDKLPPLCTTAQPQLWLGAGTQPFCVCYYLLSRPESRWLYYNFGQSHTTFVLRLYMPGRSLAH